MINEIFCYFRSLHSQSEQNPRERLIVKLALNYSVTAEEVDRIKNNLELDYQTAVKATLLMHYYGIHLALQSSYARQIIQHSERKDSIDFEDDILSRSLEISLKKLDMNINLAPLHEEILPHILEMDAVYINVSDPFTAVTKQFLRIFHVKDDVDFLIFFDIASNIGNRMKSTIEFLKALYENGYRY